ncbi:12346_t:CDS:2 [Funneliformis caledonium]|uniref:12346_t:CDS:1 n=1 Tax=Funneliformis caledonium TaxID=1117310 RepID=A0A9N9HVF2_9GLOM|nr:12346_t:CDS:2 [Funneliformis caledonium]
MGMLCYQVEGSVGPNNKPFYLLIGWKVKRMAASQFCIRVYESDEPPLQGNKQQKAEFCKATFKRHGQFTDQLISWPECNVKIGNRFRVHATMSSVSKAKMKVYITEPDNYTLSQPNNHGPRPKRSLFKRN